MCKSIFVCSICVIFTWKNKLQKITYKVTYYMLEFAESEMSNHINYSLSIL